MTNQSDAVQKSHATGSSNNLPHVVILGGGPAGVGAAYKLAQTGRFRVTLLEQNTQVGGNAGSFELAGLHVDYGSHRLHPACDPRILVDIRSLIGDDLLDRPRHGRIALQKRWIHFPLKPLDLARHLSPGFTLGLAGDLLKKIAGRFGVSAKEYFRAKEYFQEGDSTPAESFASVMERGLGRTICQEFYFPYARKIWGVEPTRLSAVQARRRVAAGSLSKMVRKVLAAIPGFRPAGSGRFYYPRHGYGQISEAYAAAAQALGAQLHLGTRITRLEFQPDQVLVHLVGQAPTLGSGQAPTQGSVNPMNRKTGQSQGLPLSADYVWSTIPITALARIIEPAPPQEILQAATGLDYRAMLLIYLVLEQEHFTEYDAHYFPSLEIHITRLSEPKNYRGSDQPAGRTVLCAELPCSPNDAEWQLGDDELGELVRADLERAGLSIRVPISQVFVRRLRYAYPIYLQGYEMLFDPLDEWLGKHERLLTFGRQGLFAHDNTHHALFMAYSAVECFDPDGSFNQARWKDFRKVFETHVVED